MAAGSTPVPSRSSLAAILLRPCSQCVVPVSSHCPATCTLFASHFRACSFPGCSGCNVHLGFYEDYTSLSSGLMSNINALNAANAPYMVFTGHSAGAAQSNLAAFELALAGYPVAVVYNYGQPRTGDPTYAAAFDSTIVNGADDVALLSALTGVPAGSRFLNISGAATASSAAAAGRSLRATRKHGKANTVTVHAVAETTLDVAVLARTHVAAAPVSAVLAHAIARAARHEVNAHLFASAAEVESLVALIAEHARKYAAHVDLKLAIAAARRAGNATASVAALAASQAVRADAFTRRALTDREIYLLKALRFPMSSFAVPADHAVVARARMAAPAGSKALAVPLRTMHAALASEVAGRAAAASASEEVASSSTVAVAPVGITRLGGFSGAQYYRVVHYADIVPHVVSWRRCWRFGALMRSLLLRLPLVPALPAVMHNNGLVHSAALFFNLSPSALQCCLSALACSRRRPSTTATRWRRSGTRRTSHPSPPAPPPPARTAAAATACWPLSLSMTTSTTSILRSPTLAEKSAGAGIIVGLLFTPPVGCTC